MKRSLSLMGGALCAAVLLTESGAQAHIVMEGALKSRTAPGALPGLDNEQKMSPCDGDRGDGPVYTFEPGATIKLQVGETIPHPSYYRIAFDNDGDDGFKEPASIKPIDPSRPCPFSNANNKAENDKCGQPDYCNVVSKTGGATVLWDFVDPHLGSEGKSVTWTIKLPDVECENCTIQILQVMEDTVHGGYCPAGMCNESNYVEDIYHRCIDIKLKKGAGTAGPGNAAGAAVQVGTPNAKYPNANINCLAQTIVDAGVGQPDSGAGIDAGAGDAGTSTDSGSSPSTGGAAGGPGGGSSGTAAGGGTTGAGSVGGGAVSGAAGGGTVSGTGATPGGNVGTGGVAGTTTGGAAGTVGMGGTAGGAPAPADDDDGGCSVAFAGSRGTGVAFVLGLLGAALLRRRRRA